MTLEQFVGSLGIRINNGMDMHALDMLSRCKLNYLQLENDIGHFPRKLDSNSSVLAVSVRLNAQNYRVHIS